MIDIKSETKKLISENLEIKDDTANVLFDMGLLKEYNCRKVLIRNEYYYRCSHMSKTDLKIMIAEKYCVSLSTVEKYITIDKHS